MRLKSFLLCFIWTCVFFAVRKISYSQKTSTDVFGRKTETEVSMIESAKVKVASFSNERFKGDLVVWGFTKSDTSDYLVLNVCLQLRRLNVLDDASNIRIKRWSKATFYFDSSSIIVKNIAFDLALYMDLYWTNALGLCPSYNVEPRHIPALLTSDIKSIQIEAEPETLTFEVSPKYQPALKSALHKLWNKKLPK